VSLTAAFISCREQPKFRWFLDSLRNQGGNDAPIIFVDGYSSRALGTIADGVLHVAPKPTVWSGPHRLTKDEWWSKSSSLNSAICLCKTDWIAFCDDRCVLNPGWLDSVREAMAGNYSVCGSYSKHSDLKVENGVVKNYGQLMGQDHRDRPGGAEHFKHHWFFGCTFALPLEWALQVNGFEELLDGLGAEDTQFGSMLRANGFEMKYDPRMRVLQDRTPGECGPEMKKTSKRRYDHDKEAKDYKAIERFYGQKQSQHPINLREIRAKVLAGEPFPHHGGQPSHDWFDGQPIKDFE